MAGVLLLLVAMVTSSLAGNDDVWTSLKQLRPTAARLRWSVFSWTRVSGDVPGVSFLISPRFLLLSLPQVDGTFWLSERWSRKLQVQDQMYLADRGTVSNSRNSLIANVC